MIRQELANMAKFYEYLVEPRPGSGESELILDEPYERSYYIVRTLALAYHHRELLPAVASRLIMDSDQAIETHDKVQLYMLNMMSDSLREQHAMAKPEEDWEPEDELIHNPNVVE